MLMQMMDWYRGVVKDASVNSVATRAGLVQSTLARQLKAETLTAESVVAVARAYGVDVLDALVKIGLVTEQDIRTHGASVALADLTDIELAAEVVRRAQSASLDAPIS